MNYDAYRCMLVGIEAGVATVTLNRPETLNAIDMDMEVELERIWTDLAADAAIRAIVLTGAGRAFCAGGNLKAMAETALTPAGNRAALDVPRRAMRLLENLLAVPQPVVAAVNGDALGLGLTLALFTDISIVADDARLGDTHVKVGLVAGDGGAVIWPLLIGVQKAKEYLMRGKTLRGAEAAAMGLVNHAVAKAEVLSHAQAMAAEMAALPIHAVRWTKLSVNKMIKQQLNQIMDASIAFEALTLMTQDYKEAATAFVEKRKPDFVGY